MTQSWEKYRMTDGMTDRQRDRRTDKGDFIGPFVTRGSNKDWYKHGIFYKYTYPCQALWSLQVLHPLHSLNPFSTCCTTLHLNSLQSQKKKVLRLKLIICSHFNNFSIHFCDFKILLIFFVLTMSKIEETTIWAAFRGGLAPPRWALAPSRLLESWYCLKIHQKWSQIVRTSKISWGRMPSDPSSLLHACGTHLHLCFPYILESLSLLPLATFSVCSPDNDIIIMSISCSPSCYFPPSRSRTSKHCFVFVVCWFLFGFIWATYFR